MYCKRLTAMVTTVWHLLLVCWPKCGFTDKFSAQSNNGRNLKTNTKLWTMVSVASGHAETSSYAVQTWKSGTDDHLHYRCQI